VVEASKGVWGVGEIELDNQPTNQEAGCYLFTVSNSGLLFIDGRLVSPRITCFHNRKRNISFCDGELWPTCLLVGPEGGVSSDGKRCFGIAAILEVILDITHSSVMTMWHQLGAYSSACR